MTLTNHWWQLIWLLLGGALLAAVPLKQERLLGRQVRRWHILPALLLMLPYALWAGYRTDSFGDTWAYRRTFLNLTADLAEIPGFFSDDVKDPGFAALSVLMKLVIGNQDTLFFLIIAVFQALCVALTFRKYSRDYWTCVFLFVASTDYMSWMHNGMRQFIAIAMIFAAMELLARKKFIPLVGIILVASAIHGSALLMIPIVFAVQGKAWNFRTILFLLATCVIIAFVDRFTPILSDLLQETQYDDVMTNGIWENDDGTNLIRVAVYSVPALLSLLGLRYIWEADDPVINICVNCSIVTMALYLLSAVTSGIYIGRLPMYTTLQGYIALPWLIDNMFTERSARLVRLLMVGAYLAFFWYQMHFTWGLI